MSSTAVLPVAFDPVAAGSPADLVATPEDKESRMRTTFSAVRTLLLAFLVLAGSLAAVFASPAQEAEAHHGWAMTLRGNTGRAGTRVCAFPDYAPNSAVACTYANRAGAYALVLSRGHQYYLSALVQIGCGYFIGYTGWFWLGPYTPNPAYVDVQASHYWTRAC